jgi:hypothetical protein
MRLDDRYKSRKLSQKKLFSVVTVALANKLA